MALLVVLVGCNRGPTSVASEIDPAGPDAHSWGYLGAGAPSHWGQLDSEYAKCSDGEFQSPIDLHPLALADVDEVTVDYHPDILRIANNGHSIQVQHSAPSVARVGGHEFKLLQYHFHSPSEHTESGAAHAMELHLVHADAAGHFAVLAVFIDEGPDMGDAALWRHLPKRADGLEHDYRGEEVNPAHFLPDSLKHYQYHGSLTTPPCTETVTWNVFNTPITMSAERIASFRELYAANARPVQPRRDACLTPGA